MNTQIVGTRALLVPIYGVGFVTSGYDAHLTALAGVCYSVDAPMILAKAT